MFCKSTNDIDPHYTCENKAIILNTNLVYPKFVICQGDFVKYFSFMNQK